MFDYETALEQLAHRTVLCIYAAHFSYAAFALARS
jgi:hypothetical protein